MIVNFLAGVVQRLERGAREFELAAGLERDGSCPARIAERDQMGVFHHRRPAETVAHAFEQPPDRALARIRNRFQRIGQEWKFLVLGADPPLLLGSGAAGEKADELRLIGNRRKHLGAVGSGTAQAMALSVRNVMIYRGSDSRARQESFKPVVSRWSL